MECSNIIPHTHPAKPTIETHQCRKGVPNQTKVNMIGEMCVCVCDNNAMDDVQMLMIDSQPKVDVEITK